jgi:hypothetical protein
MVFRQSRFGLITRGLGLPSGGLPKAGLGWALLCLLFLASVAAARTEPCLVVFSVQLRNTGPVALPRIRLRIPVPVDNEYQLIRSVAMAPREKSRHEIPGGGQVALFEYRDLAAGASAWAYLLAAVEPREVQADKGLINRALPRDVQAQCLGPSWKVDPAAQPVRELAAALAPDEKDPFAVTRAFVEHLSSDFQYELDGLQDDVVTVLAARSGSCSELSRVLVALCRARGIPARFATGSRLRERKGEVYADTIHHRWVEVFLPRYGWFPIDISMAVGRADPDRRFGAIPAGRLVLLRNAGIEDNALYSAGLALVTPDDAVATTLRTYWFQDGERTLRRGLKLVRDRLPRGGDPPDPELRTALLRLPGVQAIPFLAMALYEPVAGGDPAPAVAALLQAGVPAASVPLADLAVVQGAPQPEITAALESLTGQRLESGEAWRLWLLGPALPFLRGEEATAEPAEAPATPTP